MLGLALVLIAAALLPAAGAQIGDDGWRSWPYEGNEEPGVGLPDAERGDFDPDAMFGFANNGQGDAPPVADRIYFDAHVDHIVHPLTPHPNPDGTATRTYVQSYFHAYLGFWRDCNADGFVGDVATGAVQYPAAAANVLTSVCPESTPYNDGVTVTEMLPIAPNTRDLAESPENGALCPDKDGGPADDERKTPRPAEDEGVLEGGDNALCTGGRDEHVQDDLAKVWFDWGLPTRTEDPGVSLFPFPDGTLRDTNGHFRLVDMIVQGQISTTTGLWPSEDQRGDPAPANQCEPTSGSAGPGNALDVVGIAENAEAGLDPANNCSPIPNVRYLDVPVLGPVAWPGHLAEDRYNNSDAPNDPGQPATEPFTREGPDGTKGTQDDCGPATDPDRWDREEDGDPLYGGDVSQDPQGVANAYLGPHDDGPAFEPTWDHLYGSLVSNVETHVLGGSPDSCTTSRDAPDAGHHLEENSAPAPPGQKTRADATFGFLMDKHFNPSEAPGDPAPDASACVPQWSAVFGLATRCQGHWLSDEQYRHTHGLTALNPEAFETMITSFYADVSYGPDAFDPANDGTFEASQAVWEPPSGLVLDPSVNLPAGQDDAHRYGDVQCDSITQLSVEGNDLVAPDTITATADGWSCDRNAWAQTAELDCGTSVDELSCHLLPKVGDGYDLRDLECLDNDVAEQSMTDENGPLPAGGIGGTGLAEPGVDCDDLDASDLPDL